MTLNLTNCERKYNMSRNNLYLNKLSFGLTLAMILSSLSIQSAFSMGAFNDEILQRATQALQDSRNAAAIATEAGRTAQEARITALRARTEIDAAVNEAVGTAENRMANVAARIERDLDNRVNTAANNAAQGVRDRLNDIVANANNHATRANEQANRANDQANRANDQANRANQEATRAQRFANDANRALDDVNEQIEEAFEGLEPRLRQAAINNARQVEQVRQQVLAEGQAQRNANDLALHHQREEITRENNLRVEQQRAQNELARAQEEARLARENQAADVDHRERLGIIERDARINADAQARASVEAARLTADIKWNKIQQMFGSFGNGFNEITNDPKRMAKIGAIVVATGVGLYAAKHGMPVLISHLVQPRVVSETSKKSWFGWKAPTEKINIDDLTFKPDQQKQLLDLALRVKTAKEFNESLPNVLFFGAPGTGKTAFAKALAYWSGLDYAITSGSEFAKITDLNLANKELRKLLDWAQNSDKGLIVFIDEAESLFANRLLLAPSSPASKTVQDFINTFLALVPEKSQKNMMFIFATNHPFKLDDAITNRVGINVEFTAPEQAERIKILGSYLEKFATANKQAQVELPKATMEKLPAYAQELDGLVPRAIKFVAEEMISRARRNKSNPSLTDEIACEILNEAKVTLAQTAQWEAEREKWVDAQRGVVSSTPVAAAA